MHKHIAVSFVVTSALLWLKEHTFPFHWRLFLQLEPKAETAKTPHRKRAEKSRADQTDREQSCLAREGPGPRADSQLCCFQLCCFIIELYAIELFYNPAVLTPESQMNCLHWIKFLSSPYPKLGILLNWYQWLSVDKAEGY